MGGNSMKFVAKFRCY